MHDFPPKNVSKTNEKAWPVAIIIIVTMSCTSSSRSGASVLGSILKIFGESIRYYLRFPELVTVQVRTSSGLLLMFERVQRSEEYKLVPLCSQDYIVIPVW